MKNGLKGRRSDCPINFAVEIFGDKWSLLILRDIIFAGKRTYGEFLDSDESIATNILASRLEYLEKEGLIKREPDKDDRRKELFSLTENGISLVPVLVEMTKWSAANADWLSLRKGGTQAQKCFVESLFDPRKKAKAIRDIEKAVRRGGYYFEGVTFNRDPRRLRNKNSK